MKNCYFLALLGLFLFGSSLLSQAQIDSSRVTIEGKAYDPKEPGSFLYLMVVNQRTGQGVFGDPYGGFEIDVLRTDTVLISARGYQVHKLCVKDEAFQSTYNKKVVLKKLLIVLDEVEVYPERELEEIEDDIEQLGVKLKEIRPIRGTAALSSPITALYQRFSRIEQSKRKVAEMETADRRKELLKELLRKYVKHDIINLSEEAFDTFISYLNLSNEFIRQASSYDLIMAIKYQYEEFANLKVGSRAIKRNW